MSKYEKPLHGFEGEGQMVGEENGGRNWWEYFGHNSCFLVD